jgi:serine/threonine protein phosphatase PrpC
MQRSNQNKTAQGTPQKPTYKTFAEARDLQESEIEDAKKGRADYVASYGGISVAEVIGSRPTQEDRVVVEFIPDKVDLRQGQVLSDTLKALHDQLPRDSKGGSCGIVCAVQGSQICTANLGDSTAYVVIVDDKNNVIDCKRINKLHKPANNYLYASDGSVIAVAGAIGDSKFDRAGMIHTPDIYNDSVTIPPSGKAFVIVACDGMTEAIEQQNLMLKQQNKQPQHPTADADYVKKHVQTILQSTPNATPDELSRHLVKMALQDGSTDNISVISVAINPASQDTSIVAVFDGHGGSAVSQYCQDHFTQHLQNQLTNPLQQSQSQQQKSTSAEPAWLRRDADEQQQQSLKASSNIPEWVAKLQPEQQRQPSQHKKVRPFYNAFNHARVKNQQMLTADQKLALFSLLTTPEGKTVISDDELRKFVKTLNLQGDTRFHEFVEAYISNPEQDFTRWLAQSKKTASASVSTSTATSSAAAAAAAISPAPKPSSHTLFTPAKATPQSNMIDKNKFNNYFIEFNDNNKHIDFPTYSILFTFVLNIVKGDKPITYDQLKALAKETNNETVINFVNNYIKFSSQQTDQPVVRPRG